MDNVFQIKIQNDSTVLQLKDKITNVSLNLFTYLNQLAIQNTHPESEVNIPRQTHERRREVILL